MAHREARAEPIENRQAVGRCEFRLGQHWAGSMITLASTDVVHLLIAGARIQTCRSDLPVRLSCFGAVPLGGLLGGCA
jgi:hypothetical protein